MKRPKISPITETNPSLAKQLYSSKVYSDNTVFDINLPNGGVDWKLKISDDTDGVVLIEGHFKFFEVENLLRQICHDMFEPLRQRIVTETEAGR